jgi:hypothetical protein
LFPPPPIKKRKVMSRKRKLAATTQTIPAPEAPRLTVDLISSAMAAMNNYTAQHNDAVDAAAMAMNATAELERRRELRSWHPDWDFAANRQYHGRHPLDELQHHVSTRVEENRRDGHITYTTRFFGVPVSHRCDVRMLDHVEPPERHHIAAREITNRLARELMPMIVNQIERAEAEELRNAYGRRDRWNGVRHMMDEARAFIPTKSIPLESWLKHKEFELNGWKATLLETEEQITAEGENMQHCFARSYRGRVAKKEYIAYHITAPEGKGLPKSGFTMGFTVDISGDKRFIFDQVKGKKNDTHHCQNIELLKMIEHIDKAVNKGHVKMPDNIETREVKINFTAGAVNVASGMAGV